jgi:membrane-associated protein
MRFIFFVLLFCCINVFAVAQHAGVVNATVVNQYESNEKAVAVEVLRTGVKYLSDSKGNVRIRAIEGDSVRLIKEGHDTTLQEVKPVVNGTTFTIKKNFSWKDLLTPMFYILNGGLWLLLFIIFAETGLFVGFFLPGDSLLFVAGIFSNKLAGYLFDTHSDFVNLLILIVLTSIAGILGNFMGYWFGKKIGPAMFSWRDRFLFKKKYLHQAKDFYDQHGGGAIIFARFLPIVRTFAPIVAGIVNMDQKKFTFFNIVGCVAWTGTMLAAGHYLDKLFIEQFNFDLKKHLEIIVLVIVFVTTLPVIVKLISGKKKPAA